MPGPLPKAQRQRERDTRRAKADFTTLVDDKKTRGPALKGDFRAETRAWYRTWQKAPQAQLFEATDWARLQLMAPIVDAYYTRPSAAALSEIRLNEERLGATYGDRLRQRMAIADDGPDEVAGLAAVTPIQRPRRDV